jgi:hypothetical protein
LAVHLAFALGRIPGKVFAKRAGEIERYRAEGAASLLGNAGFGGVETIDWLRAHVPADAVLLWRGVSKGPIELVPGLLGPRLLVVESAVAAGAEVYGDRPLAQGTLPDGRTGVLVLEGRGSALELGIR